MTQSLEIVREIRINRGDVIERRPIPSYLGKDNRPALLQKLYRNFDLVLIYRARGRVGC